MATTITVPKDYGYVLLAAASTTLLGSWLAFRLVPYRKAAQIKMPQVYAEQSDFASAKSSEHRQALYLFNCAQRAHGNFVEHHPSLVVAMLIAGLKFPLLSAGLGAAWSASRVLYARGYTDPRKSEGKGRYIGIVFIPLQSVLILMAMWVGGQFALQ